MKMLLKGPVQSRRENVHLLCVFKHNFDDGWYLQFDSDRTRFVASTSDTFLRPLNQAAVTLWWRRLKDVLSA